MAEHDRHSLLEPGNQLMIQERERALVRLFRRAGIRSLADFRVFEAGCAGGYQLRLAVQWGARPENVAGIDLDPAAVDYCRAHASDIRVHLGSADAIPEPDATFDLVLAFTLFSSVREDKVSSAIAAELLRITRPGGLILVYDMRRRSPRNRAVHPISARDVRRWFPGRPVATRSMTLAPPLARIVGRRAPWLYGPLALLPPLRTHALHIIRNTAGSTIAGPRTHA